LLAQRANFVGEFDGAENVKKLAKVTKEREGLVGQVEWLTKEYDARDRGRVLPSDYTEMELSSTRAWPRAIEVIMPHVYPAMKVKHDQIMDKWVQERGDGLLPTHYDYLVYSHAIVWDKVLDDSKVSIPIGQDIRKKYVEIMGLLYDD